MQVPPLVTVVSKSHGDAKKRTLQLFRDFMRLAPSIVERYGIPYTTPDVRRRIRVEFERNRYIDDLNLVNIMLLKGRQEYDETVNEWKQPNHVMQIMEDCEARDSKKPATFMEDFYSGK